MPVRSSLKPIAWIVAVVLGLAGGAGLFWFQPWKLFTDREVDEAITEPIVPSRAAPGPSAPVAAPTPGPALLRRGTFISHEHTTTGVARLIRHPDGLVVELVGLDTSNGPDLRVWLSDQPVRGGAAGWRVFDDGEWLELGRLKGNKGNQTYAVPAGADLDELTSVSIWCKRFSVSFGAAALETV
ncbi:DM13 domain-containing protein [Actinoplanes sp. CA-131856]